MRSIMLLAASLLLIDAAPVMAADLPEMPKLPGAGASPLAVVNKSLARQQVKDGQFEFKTGRSDFAPGNEKRIKGLLKIITDNSNALKAVDPNIYVIAEGHTDAEGSPDFNQMLSLARAKTVCRALKAKGMALACKPIGLGSSKPLVSPEKTPADKQRNRRVLVQIAS